MPISDVIFIVVGLLAVFCSFVSIGLMFYVGKTRIKEVDKAVLGYEMPHDSIFALMLRVPNYAGGFMWKWSARRTGLEGKIEHFDSQFQWPFKAVMVFAIAGGLFFIIGIVMQKYFGV